MREPYWSKPRGRRPTVIARVWTGRTKAEDYDSYLAYLEESGVAALKATAGNRGVMVLRRLHGAEAEFSVMSFWDSLDDVKAFAGEDVDAARYFPDDERFLLDFPPRLKHFEVARER
jgi:heme-degrading monooxygenase HmoA